MCEGLELADGETGSRCGGDGCVPGGKWRAGYGTVLWSLGEERVWVRSQVEKCELQDKRDRS